MIKLRIRVLSVLTLTIAVCMGNLSYSAPTGYTSEGLVAFYDGLDNAGTGTHSMDTKVWVDLSGNNHNILLENATALWNGYSLLIDSEKIFLPIELIEALNGEEFTLEFTIGTMESKGVSFNTFVNSTNDMLSLFRRVDGDFIEFKNNVNGRPKIDGGLEYYNNSTIAVTFNIGGYCTLYVNGDVISESSSSVTLGIDDLFIGHNDASRNHKSEYVALRIYDKELTEEQIKANYNADIETMKKTRPEIAPTPTKAPTPTPSPTPTKAPTFTPAPTHVLTPTAKVKTGVFRGEINTVTYVLIFAIVLVATAVIVFIVIDKKKKGNKHE